MGDRILVTGARGFIGRHLVRALQLEGTEVLEHSTRQGDIAHCELPYAGVDWVFHLAGRSFVPASWTDSRRFYETNVLGTINVLEFCRRTGAALTLVSSYVYGQPLFLPISESHPLQAVNPYAHSKIMAEDAARFYAVQFAQRITVIRPFNIYGPGQDTRFLIPTLLNQALDPALPAISVQDLKPRRDYLHVRDLIALLLASRNGPSGAYNAGTGASWSVAEVIELINSLLPRPKPVSSVTSSRSNEISDVRADITKAKSAFNWSPKVELRDGISQLMDAFSSGGDI